MAANPRPPRRALRPAPDEHLRLMTKVVRLYHEHGIRQPEIARRLHVSQARVSRLLKQAETRGTASALTGVQAAGGRTNDYLRGDALLSGNRVVAAAPAVYDSLDEILGRAGGADK